MCLTALLPSLEYKKLVGDWFRGGIYDTKYLSRRIPEVFDGWTSLGDVFKAVTEGERGERVVQVT